MTIISPRRETPTASKLKASLDQSDRDWSESDTEQFVKIAASMGPVLASREAATISERSVPKVTIGDLKQAGLFRLLQPRRYGGFDADFDAPFRVVEELAQGCGSTAWVYGVLGLHSRFLSVWSPEAQDEVWGDDHGVLICSSLNPKPVRRVDGGHVLNGEWSFSSGCDHSDWVMIGGTSEGAAPVLMLLPLKEAEIVDDWYTLGLRGTGSKSLRFRDAFVPDRMTVPHASINGLRPGGAPNFIHSLWDSAPVAGGSATFASVILGLVRRAMSTVAAALRTRVSRGVKLSEIESHHMRLGEVAATLDICKFYLHEKARLISLRARSGVFVTLEEIKSQQRDISVIMRRLREAIDLLSLCHSMWVYDSDPLQVIMRDIATASTHLSGRWEAFVMPSGKEIVQQQAFA